MQLTLWTYEGPPHIGAMRVASAMRGVHYVLHAPQGDTYADLLFTMIERRDSRPPVTYTTFQARDLGSDTAELFKGAVREAYELHRPDLMIVGASCTAELLQDDPGGLAATMGLPIPVVPLELPAYQKKENWGAAETFYQIVRTVLRDAGSPSARDARPERRPLCNILGPTALGFRHRDDLAEISRLIRDQGIDINVVAPLGASPTDVARLPRADFNVVLVPEVALTTARLLERSYGQPMTSVVPIGVGATADFIAEIRNLAGLPPAQASGPATSRLPWYSRSVDSTYLTGKRVFIFGDGSHVVAAARVATQELGFTIAGLGTYSREMAREVRATAAAHNVEALITDDYLEVEARIRELAPELVLGTQMERHVAKRLAIPCAVISAPVHVQDFPARYSPQMGWEGANVLFDTWVHPLTMGLEEHLLAMFRDDFEFRDDAGPSHLGAKAPSIDGPARAAPFEKSGAAIPPAAAAASTTPPAGSNWSQDAEAELRKIPFFVRGKARRNTEQFASERGLATITIETLYDAKAHFSR